MPLDKAIIKAQIADSTTFEYKPREFSLDASSVAKNFVADDAFKSSDFKIADLIAKQAGISQLEDDAHQDRINAQVLERLKEVEERAYREGYELGLVQGTEKAFQNAKQDLLGKTETLEKLLKRVEDLKARILVDNEAALLHLLYLIAKKMALRDLEENREAVLSILQSITNEIQADEKVVVQLSQQDLDFLKMIHEKSDKKLEVFERIKFVVNNGVKPGGCLIETEYGNVDATVEERVERTWQTLLSRVPRNNPDKT
jgi:flagellar assembly protein FliH